MAKKKDKRALVLRIREQKRKQAKEDRAIALAMRQKMAQDYPTPKLTKTVPVRTRTRKQIIACDNLSVWSIPGKQLARLGILRDAETLNPEALAYWQSQFKAQLNSEGARNAAATKAWSDRIAESLTVDGPALVLKAI